MATAAFDETLRVDSLVGALLLHTGNALWSSSVQSCPDEDASVPAAALRELFLADQLQQVTASTARPRGLHSKHCTRRRRQQQHPDFQQLQQQPLQPACDDLEGDSEFFSDGILGTKQHKGAADLSEHLHVKLRVLSSSSTAGTISGSFCSRNSSLTGNALGRLSIDGHSGAAGNCIAQPSAHPVLHPQQHIAVPAPPAPAQCAHNQQQPHGTEQVHQAQQRAALAVPLSARASLVTGRLEEDVSAQKAAAQALFAEQQQMQAAGSKSCTSFEPGLLQQEQTRLMQQGFQPRLFASMLLGNLLCCLMVVAAKGPLGRHVGTSALQWPLLILLSCALGWLFMARLKPLHFAHAALERQYAARSQHGRCLLDLWFSMAGCSGVLAAVRSHTGPVSAPQAFALPTQPLAGLQIALPVLLIAVLLSGSLLLLVSPRLYRRWREQLLFVGKVALVSGMVTLQPGNGSFPGVQIGFDWLPFVGRAQQQAQGPSVLLAMGSVQAFMLLTLMVRVSAYIPMQLIHVSALLVTVANSGSSGLGMMLYALQLLTCSLWAPTCVLSSLELSARRSFLARQLPHHVKQAFKE